MPAWQIGPAEYAERLDGLGYEVARVGPSQWTAQCPCHDDRTPSLRISAGRDQELVLYCHGCQADFRDLLAAVGIVPIGEIDPSSSWGIGSVSECQYLRIEGDVVPARVRSVGIDVSDCRAAIEDEAAYPGGGVIVKMPQRAGRVMRLVLEDIVRQANERIASGWQTTPIAYGSMSAAERLGVRKSGVTEALAALEKQGIVERVHRLPDPVFRFEGLGAWTWRLVVTPVGDGGDMAKSRGPTCGQVQAVDRRPTPDDGPTTDELTDMIRSLPDLAITSAVSNVETVSLLIHLRGRAVRQRQARSPACRAPKTWPAPQGERRRAGRMGVQASPARRAPAASNARPHRRHRAARAGERRDRCRTAPRARDGTQIAGAARGAWRQPRDVLAPRAGRQGENQPRGVTMYNRPDPAELDAEIRDGLTGVRGELPAGPADAILNAMMDERGWPTLDQLAVEQEWS